MLATGLAAGLLAGTAAAQEVPAPVPAPPMEFRGADGKPLPADIQAQLRERFKDGLPAATATPGTSPGDIVVRAQRPRGAVLGDIPPERTFSPADIRAYGANTVEELIGALGQQVASGRGRDDAGPVVLLNGKRVSSFAEIARLPPEAIERMEVFPEEVALRYGYRADQKVVNVVAFERFSSRIGQFTYAAPTGGGRDTAGLAANLLRIRGDTRYGLDADYNRSGKLLESERDLRQVGGADDLGRFRTLLPSTERFTANGVVATTILGDVSAAINGRVEASGSEALLGRGEVGPLTRDVDTRIAHLGTTLGGREDGWQWTLTGNYDRTRVDTATDRAGTATRDTARSVNAVAGADLLLAGTVLTVPAGPVSTSVRAGVELRDLDARARVGGVERTSALGRDRGSVQASLDLPLTGARMPVLGALSANANAGVERLSDAGTLTTIGGGLNWSPVPAVSLVASITAEEGAPTVEQLGAPPIVTPNARTFDFVRGETVDITRVTGGNRALRPDDRRVLGLGLTVKPLPRTDLTISLDYLSTRIDDPVAAFPIATRQIEAAFPERFGRDADGRLQRIDATPLNFLRSDQEQLRWGISLVRPIGPVPAGLRNANVRYFSSEADARRRLPPNAVITRVDPNSPAGRRAENLSSRLIFSLQHSWRLRDEVLLRPGVPPLDLLDGGALDARGGRPRHEVEVQAGAFKRGLGARLTATWQSGTRVNGLAAADGTVGDLDFGSLATLNLSLFANVATYLGGDRTPRWAGGLRLSLGVTNLFDALPQVRDAAGATPITYQPAYLNPLGRTVSLGLRKLF